MMNEEDLKKKRDEIFDSLDTKIKEPDFQCDSCKGRGKNVWHHNLEIMDCYYCSGSGSKVEQLLKSIEYRKGEEKSLREENRYLTDFIKSTSTCKTCGGDRGKTFGLGLCVECGIEGNCPWPG